MEFVTVPLVLLAVSLCTLVVLHSYDRERLEVLNSYWEVITLGILALLLLLGLIYFAVSVGFLLGNMPIMKLFMKGVIVLSIPIVVAVLGWVMSKTGFSATPNGGFLDTVTYLSVYWLLVYHLEGLVNTAYLMRYLAVIILVISLLMFATLLLLIKFRRFMKRHMMQPLDAVGALRGIMVTFTLIAIAGLSASYGLIFTHVMSDMAGALTVLAVLIRLLSGIKIYLKGVSWWIM